MSQSQSSPPTATTEKQQRHQQESKQMEDTEIAYPKFLGDLPWSQRSWMYELMPFRGIYFDFRRRLPFLASDWTTAFHVQNWWTVLQYIPRMYFINLMPAISYIIDMNHRTGGAYGLNEVILASALAAIVFPIFSIQPLTFVGVTGLINLVNYTQYDLVVGYYGLDRIDYLRVQAWSLIWAAGFHFIVSIFNICDFTRFITDMTSQTFGFYVGIVYIQKGIELLLLEFEPLPLNNATGWLSVTIAILFTVSVYLVTAIGKTSFLPFKIRYFVSSFAFAAGCIFWTGFSHFPKNSLEKVPIERLPITKSFFPTIDRGWFIDFWNIEARWAFVGAPLGFLIMLLFYFDHNVSSVMAQARQFPVKRPAGFHWDFFLLGITTLVSGFLGLPAPNGLVPQCPWSTEALSVYEQIEIPQKDEEGKPMVGRKKKTYQRQHIVITRVVENRLGHLIVGLLTLGTMSRPLLVVLGTMPRAIFAGIFLLVGWSSIEGNIITTRTLAIFKDRHLASESDGLFGLKRSKIALFVGIQWLFFAMTIAISQTIAAIGFPVIITLLIPFRYYIVPKWFTPDELRILDSATADAEGVLASIGQETEAVTGQGQRVARDTGIAGTEWSDDEDDDDDFGGHYNDKAEKPSESGAPGYVIRDEDDHDGIVVKPTDKSALMADLGGGGAAGEGPSLATPFASSGAAPAIVNDAVTTSSPSKNNKRTKSATQSWWELGGSKAVERAPSPHMPNEPSASETPDIIPIEAARVGGDAKQEEKTDTSGTTGLKKFFSIKRKEVSGLSEEEAQQPSTVELPVQENLTKEERKEAIDEHFATHFGATKVEASPEKLDMVALPPPGETPSAADKLDDNHNPFADAAAGTAAGTTAEKAEEGLEEWNMLEKAVDKIESAMAINSTDHGDAKPVADTTVKEANDKPAQNVEEATPIAAAATTSSTTKPKSTPDDDKAKQRAEASAASAAAGAETQRTADEYKRREKEAREARVAEKKAKEDEKQRAKEEKAASKKKAKEDAQKKKNEAVLAKRKEKGAGEKKKQEAKDEKMREEREKTEQKRQANEEQRRKEAATAAAKKEADAAKERNEKEAQEQKKREEQSKALEDEQSKKKQEAEAAALALLVANKKSTEEEVAKRKAQNEKEAAERKEKEEVAMAEADEKRQALQAEIAELEAKAKSNRLFLAPAKVSKSSLNFLSGQVAGHEASIYTVADGALVVKSCSPFESGFYQNTLIHQRAVTSKNQQELLTRLKKYLPTYHGTVQLTSDLENGSTKEGENFAVILENLTRGYKHANVLDIKLGKQLWDDTASEEKKQRLDDVAKNSTSAETGLRLTGWQIWDNEKSKFVKVGKAFGKVAKVDELPLGLHSFFGLASKEEAAQISKIASEQVTAVVLPEKPVERLIQDGVVPAIKEIIEIVKKLEWRIRGSSLLIIFEGDKTELNKINAKSNLEAGRGLIDTDQLVDATNLNSPTVLKSNSSRLIDVRLIDFAHASFGKEKGADEGYLSGLETTKNLLEDISKALRKGTLRQIESTQSDNILKTSGGAALIGSITSLFSRDKNEADPKGAIIKGKNKDVVTPAPALSLAMTETVAKPVDDSPSDQVTPVEAGNTEVKAEEVGAVAAGAGAGVAAVELEKKSEGTENKKDVKRRQSSLIASSPTKQAPQSEQKAMVETLKKDRTSKQGGFLGLFSARLVDSDKKKNTEMDTPKEEKIVLKTSVPEEVTIATPKKEKNSADENGLKAAVPASVISIPSKETKEKGKTKESEETDKKAEPFWQVKDESEKPQEVIPTSPTKSASGKRVLYRHENKFGAGKPPPGVQFRDPSS